MRIEHNEDKITVSRVLAGDFDAFENLVQKYEGRIYRHLRKMVRDNQLAQDLLQETFLSAYKGLQGFTGASSFSTWLFRIATNTALMYLRKNRPESVEYSDEIRGQGGLPVHASPDFTNTPLDILLSNEGRKKIEQAIDELPLLYRSVIVLRDVEGFSLEEVSKIMDSSVAAVKSRLHRARNFVREALTSYYVEKELSDKRKTSRVKP
jgi:RNA polymerase sigma-70 factor, ECF subfamily